MRIKDLLALDSTFELAAGESGVNRTIRTVSVMDSPDIYQWMKGGDLLVTSGYIIQQNKDSIHYIIKELNEAGVSGLAIKLGKYIPHLPEDVAALCDELQFPIISIPHDYAFADMINMILSEMLNIRTEKLNLSRNIHKRFTDIVINGYGIQRVIDVLAEFTQRRIIYQDIYFNQIYRSDVSSVKTDNELDYNDCYIVNVEIGKTLLGYLIVENYSANMSDEEKVAIEQATTVLTLERQKEISNHQTHQKYLDQLVQDIILNNIKTIEELENRASLYQIEPNQQGVICIIVDLDHYKKRLLAASPAETAKIDKTKEEIFKLAQRAVNKQFIRQLLQTSFSDQLVILIEPKDKSKFKPLLHDTLQRLRLEVSQQTNFTVTIGVGNYKEEIIDAHQSYYEAKEAVKSAQFINNSSTVVLYDKIWYYKVLMEVAKSHVTRDFLSNYLTKLEQADSENNGSYVETLKVLVQNNWNYKQTSEALFVHHNTVKYRVEKIEEILDIDLKDSGQRFQLQLYFIMKALTKDKY